MGYSARTGRCVRPSCALAGNNRVWPTLGSDCIPSALFVPKDAFQEALMPPHPTRSPRHILAINNDADVLKAFRDLLEDEGYRVTTQVYADRNLGGIVELAPDLIILDYMWSSDDGGWSLLQMLRMDPRTAQIPIVLCIGAARDVEALKGRL